MIRIDGLRLLCHVGVPVAERAARQPIQVDLELEVDLGPAARSDDVADTVDYGEVTEAVAAALDGGSHALLESLAAIAADTVLDVDDRVRGVTVTVTKLRPPIARDVAAVSVRLHRDR